MSVNEPVVLHRKRAPIVVSASHRRPSNDEIAQRAYEIFLLRGASHGSDLDDWLRAEQELTEAS